MWKGLAALAVLLSGCDLYFGGDGNDDPLCYAGAEDVGNAATYTLRDPSTGQCRYDGGDDCRDSCGPCVNTPAPRPDWGMCHGACEDLDEQTCFATPGCYAAYLTAPTALRDTFWGCWDTAPSGPVEGTCRGLDAYECSRHDNCIATYETSGLDKTGATGFARCADEPETKYCITSGDCGGNAFCDTTVCYPSPTCTPCDTCGPCPDSNTCYGVCVPECSQPLTCELVEDEAACRARADCVPVYEGDQCTCTPNRCDCQILTYDRCETL